MIILALAPHYMGEIPQNSPDISARASGSSGVLGNVRWLVSNGVGYVGGSGFCVPNAYGLNLGIVSDIVEEFARDPSVKATLVQLETPGGYIAFCDTVNASIAAHAAVKPIHAVSETMTSSAGYWAIASASRILAVKGAQVGSVGVIAKAYSFAERNAQTGVKSYTFATGELKSVGTFNDDDLTDEQKEYLSANLHASFSSFKSAVLARNLDPSVYSGGVFTNESALNARLVDGFTKSARSHFAALQNTYGG